jgi:hypothetical protein
MRGFLSPLGGETRLHDYPISIVISSPDASAFIAYLANLKKIHTNGSEDAL